MQFNLRAIFVVTALVALALAFRPKTPRDFEEVRYLKMALNVSLLGSLPLIYRARKIARQGAGTTPEPRKDRSMLALVLAVLAIFPFAVFWLIGQVEPYESSSPPTRAIVPWLFYAFLGSYLPAAVCLAASFYCFRGAKQNPPLMILRVYWVAAWFILPAYLIYFVIPRLG